MDTAGIDGNLTVNLSGDNLKQVLINILLNTVDAIPVEDRQRERRIMVETEKEGAAGVIRVRDTGVGIKKEDLGKIFDPFFSTKETGSGIGLSLVYRIVSNAGGTISVESEENRGTAITLRLPLIVQNEG